jgi:hypothetical protein
MRSTNHVAPVKDVEEVQNLDSLHKIISIRKRKKSKVKSDVRRDN